MLLGTYRNLRQVHFFFIGISRLGFGDVGLRFQSGELSRSQLESEFFGKPATIPLEGLVEAAGRNAVQSRKIRISG